MSLENGVKKYDKRIEVEKKIAEKKKKDAEKERGKENKQQTPLLRASALQPHVGGSAKVKALNNPADQGTDPRNALINEIKKKDSQNEKQDLHPKSEREPSSKDKLLASIKDRRKSQTAKSAPDAAVSDRVRHINTNTGRKESRVLLVNRMMNEAPDSVKQGKLNTVCSQIMCLALCKLHWTHSFSCTDFLKGVTYQKTEDPLLRKIYEKEEKSPVQKTIIKSLDPRQELMAAIQSREVPD